MIDKTRLGIPFFDERFGGIFRKRSALCVGRQGSGKTIAALQALLQSARQGERGLMLSGWRAHDLAIIASRMGLPLSDALEKGQVTLLEYANLMPTPEFEKNITLPPGSFMEFQDIIESGGISRVVIDTILPWVAIPQEDKLLQHIYSFVQALERMGITAVLTIPRPVSPLAHTLKNHLEQQIPVVFTLDRDDSGKHTLLLNKYLGETALPPPFRSSSPGAPAFSALPRKSRKRLSPRLRSPLRRARLTARPSAFLPLLPPRNRPESRHVCRLLESERQPLSQHRGSPFPVFRGPV